MNVLAASSLPAFNAPVIYNLVATDPTVINNLMRYPDLPRLTSIDALLKDVNKKRFVSSIVTS